MKKLFTFILLGLLSVNLNVFSAKEEQKQIITMPQKQQLSKIEKVKVAAASLGCALFTTALLMTYPTKTGYMEDLSADLQVKHIPTMIIGGPVGVAFKLLCGNEFNENLWAGITGVTSFALAAGCGSYIYKKLSTLKTSKTVKA